METAELLSMKSKVGRYCGWFWHCVGHWHWFGVLVFIFSHCLGGWMTYGNGLDYGIYTSDGMIPSLGRT